MACDDIKQELCQRPIEIVPFLHIFISMFLIDFRFVLFSSISGCIRKFMINEQMLTLATVEKSYDVYYGVCEQGVNIRHVN